MTAPSRKTKLFAAAGFLSIKGRVLAATATLQKLCPYSAFHNRFQAIPGGTRFTLCADIALKGVYRLLAPFVRGYIRHQTVKLVLEPMRRAAESRR